MHGYEMIQELEARTDGLSRPSPGSIYSTLQLLEDEELVTREESEGKHGQASDMYASDAVGKQQGPDLALQSQADGGIRTLDPRFTRAVLWPTELRRRAPTSVAAGMPPADRVHGWGGPCEAAGRSR
jgi:DNA-binding PadR family transcriptional regulator